MTIRKNFNFEEEVVRQLEEMAQSEGKTQTQIAKEAIEAFYRKMKTREKLKILDEVEDTFHGLLTHTDPKKLRIEHTTEKYGG